MTLSLEHISKAYGEHQVLRDVSLSVDAGQVVGLLGHNGAGKTTLLRIATLLLRPDNGQVLFDGHPMQPADLEAIGYLPEERGLYRQMRVGEQALYLMRLKGMSRRDAKQSLRQWFDRLGMASWWDRPTRQLSKGMQQRLQLVVSVAHRPRLLVLDEPFSGFDDESATMLQRELETLRSSGTAILLATHNRHALGLTTGSEAILTCNKTIEL